MGPSTSEYIFIRACIIFLHWITPLSIALCAIIFVFKPNGLTLPLIVKAWLVLETIFYFVVYFPLRHHLQKPATHPELILREKRRVQFIRCMEDIPDPERYLSKWFMDSPSSEIKRENVKEFLRWAFLSTGEVNEADEDEVEEYTVATEEQLGRKFEPGRGQAKCLRLTLDKVTMTHRSLFWYLVSKSAKSALQLIARTVADTCPSCSVCSSLM